jgi:hypothetical protein
MAAAPTPTQARPETLVFRVEELIAHARAGRLRVPSLQRGLRWERADVQQLIDSIWRGYPIGTLLLWSKPGPAGRVTLGDLAFDVGEQPSAWFVVDGQQRIVSLVSTLIPDARRSPQFELYFDLETGAVVPPRQGAPATYLPLNRVVDSEELLAWVDEHRAALAPEQVRLAFRVGKALREYELPAHVVSVDDERVVREIFQRMNTTGKALEAGEVFDALRAPLDRRKPALSLKDLVDDLRARSRGEPDEDQALRGLLAIERNPLTAYLQRRLGRADTPAAIEQVQRALDRAFGFLAQDAGIPHLRLLPSPSALIALSAYLDRFPTPSARARRLLTRWLWRGAATGELRGDSEGMRVALDAVQAGRSDEEAARGILATVSARRPDPVKTTRPFDLRDARSKLSVIALVELRPHDLRTGALLDIMALLDLADEVVPQIVTPSGARIRPDQSWVFSSVGNRILHPSTGGPSMLSLVEAAARVTSIAAASSAHVLASHAISAEAARALQEGERVRFLELRRDQIEAATARLVDRHAEWDHSDRPSIAALIAEED